MNSTKFKRNTGSLLNKVKFTDTRVVVEKRGEEFAVLEGVKTKTSVKDLFKYKGSFPGIGKHTLRLRDEINGEFTNRASL